MGNVTGKSVDDHLFDLRFTGKQLEREAARCRKNVRAQRALVAKAIKEGRHEFAEVHAANCIREAQQEQKYSTLAARMDVAASRLKDMIAKQQAVSGVIRLSSTLNSALETKQFETIANIMDQWEEQAVAVDGAASTISKKAPVVAVNDNVQSLVDDIAAELKVGEQLSEMPAVPAERVHVPAEDTTSRSTELQDRLQQLMQ
ncbi:Snf7 [Plasmodiophora brassicae]|nr:hypothetical protein PBRA_003678 [Plasmodiophora brassicae]